MIRVNDGIVFASVMEKRNRSVDVVFVKLKIKEQLMMELSCNKIELRDAPVTNCY